MAFVLHDVFGLEFVGIAEVLDVSAPIEETTDRGDDSHESDRGDGPGCGNGRDDAGGAARAAGSDQRRRR
ncbi:hypothetical protein [Microbispora sp. ATCC PTA-5024]|uniref:hypothetical protein n=1 Tax=Microbispora sp. ATCC PTA-5024 TaxID=316330 RepID=UPI0018DB89F9